MTMTNAEWLLKQGIKFDDVYLTAPANYTYVIEDKTGRKLGSVDNSYSEISAFQKWLDAEHVESILDDVEKKYLSAVIKPFRKRVKHISKEEAFDCSDEFIHIELSDGDISDFPNFKANTMYKGMKLGRKYTLEDLGL